jgi:four helix bundle protein
MNVSRPERTSRFESLSYRYMPPPSKNIIVDKTLDFGIKIVDFTDDLRAKRRFAIADQLLRSGTSIGANTWESQDSSTTKEFVRTLKIALKEAGETEYWLHLCNRSNKLPSNPELMSDLIEIKRIISKIIITSKSKLKAEKAPKKSPTAS